MISKVEKNDDECYIVLPFGKCFKIGLISIDGEDPFYTYDVEFPTHELAFNVCQMLTEQYNEGLNENYQ